ncbi:hypothetical protein [Propionibacterium sp.]|uniref:hypothetical protein n=1 Tax=Propionibacterium sp. TaxID=1977903 RepID=UPI0039E7E3C5
MVKIPAPMSRLLKEIAVAYGASVATALLRRLSNPENAEQARHIADRLADAARSRTAEGRVRSTLEVLRAQLAMVEVRDEDDRIAIESWRRRMHALDATLDLISKGYHGRERRHQIRRLQVQTDALLAEFLEREQNIMNGETAADPGQAPEQA